MQEGIIHVSDQKLALFVCSYLDKGPEWHHGKKLVDWPFFKLKKVPMCC
jgi:hypothetical protein